jgi:hypothetical protein
VLKEQEPKNTIQVIVSQYGISVSGIIRGWEVQQENFYESNSDRLDCLKACKLLFVVE